MSFIVADYFDALVPRWNSSGKPADFPKSDQIIFYIISVRCEMDINGFDSIFEQLLTEKEFLFFLESLSELEEKQLYSLFNQVYSRLTKIEYFNNEDRCLSTSDDAEVARSLEDLGNEIRDSNLLWELDEKLEILIKNS